MHCRRGHATYLHEIGARFRFPVKHNQPGAYTALDAPPWALTPIGHRSVEHGHGRTVTRTIQVLPTPADLPFPHLNQVWLIERYTHDTTGAPIGAVAQLSLTSLTPPRPTPPRSPNSSNTTGTSSRFTGSATPSTTKTTPAPEPATDPTSWPP